MLGVDALGDFAPAALCGTLPGGHEIVKAQGCFTFGLARYTESVGIIRVGEEGAEAGKAFEGVGRRKESGR